MQNAYFYFEIPKLEMKIFIHIFVLYMHVKVIFLEMSIYM